MKLKVLTTVSDRTHKGLEKLEYSLKHFGYDYHIIENKTIGWDWGGWDNVYQYLKNHIGDYTHIIYTDGFDTLALAPQADAETALQKILTPNPNAFVYSTEKQFFPYEDGLDYSQYFSNEVTGLTDAHRWRYVNGGQYAGSVQAVINWYEKAPKHHNNQFWANKYFATLNNNKDLILDTSCELFQTVAFTTWDYGNGNIMGGLHNSLDEFEQVEVNGQKRIRNKLLNVTPVFLHGNGRTDMQFVYDCLGL